MNFLLNSIHFRVKFSSATIYKQKKIEETPMFLKFVKAGSTAIGCTARVRQKKNTRKRGAPLCPLRALPSTRPKGCWVWRHLRLPWRCGKPRSSKPVSVEAIGNASCCTTVSHKNTCLVMGKLTGPWRRPGVSKSTPGFVRSGKTKRRGGTKNKV